MASGYTKLFSSILQSTIWNESPVVCKVWITMLALTDADGYVAAAIPGLAVQARISLDECQAALAALMEPDPYSRTKDEDGRRIRAVDGGWELVNYRKYREMMTKEARREANAERMRRVRATERSAQQRTDAHNSAQDAQVRNVSQAEAEAILSPNGDSRPDVRPDPASVTVRPEEYANVWNQNRGHLPKVVEFTESRRRKVKTRIAQGLTLDRFAAVVRRCRATPFLSGQNGNGWCASFDWLIGNDTNVSKVMEGKYDGGIGGSGATRTSSRARTGGNVDAARQALRAMGCDATDGAGGSTTGGSDATDPLALRPGVERAAPARYLGSGGGAFDDVPRGGRDGVSGFSDVDCGGDAGEAAA